MKRNRLSHKKAEMISAARKANTSNPFIIYDFYKQLAEVRYIFKIFLVIKWLLFPTTSWVNTEITKKEIKKGNILQNLLLPWKIWLYLSICHVSLHINDIYILYIYIYIYMKTKMIAHINNVLYNEMWVVKEWVKLFCNL